MKGIFILSFWIFLLFLVADSSADSIKWISMGETNDGEMILYYDRGSLQKDETYTDDLHFFITVKKVPTNKKIEALRKEFKEKVVKAAVETNSKIEDVDRLFEVAVLPDYTKIYTLEFFCKSEEFKVIDKTLSSSLMITYKFDKYPAEKMLKKKICDEEIR